MEHLGASWDDIEQLRQCDDIRAYWMKMGSNWDGMGQYWSILGQLEDDRDSIGLEWGDIKMILSRNGENWVKMELH